MTAVTAWSIQKQNKIPLRLCLPAKIKIIIDCLFSCTAYLKGGKGGPWGSFAISEEGQGERDVHSPHKSGNHYQRMIEKLACWRNILSAGSGRLNLFCVFKKNPLTRFLFFFKFQDLVPNPAFVGDQFDIAT